MSTILAGKYEVIQRLGKGNYGEVFLVKHRDLGIQYAIKVLNRALSEDTRFIERFKREAEILVRFTHPGSVHLRDFGHTEDGLYYMAMDYVQGVPLSNVIDQSGHLSAVDALKILTQVLEVLSAAHAHGVVHRDIKPDNIMIVSLPDGGNAVRILDFGIAKVREEALASTETIEGITIGTPHYMSPEQAAGEGNLDSRVDIYSVGVLAYEMLSGTVPFHGDTVVQTLLMHITKAPPRFSESLQIPETVSGLVFKALEKNREQRFASCEEFLMATGSVLQELEGSMREQAAIEIKEQPTADACAVSSAETEKTSKAKTKIICLDDNEMILNIARYVLEREGYEVITTTDCSALHQHLFKGDISLLLSDVQMPGITGTRVCQLLKVAFKDLKVILFSSLPERELEKLAAQSKADGYIYKSAKPDAWVEKIKEILAHDAIPQ